MRNLGGDLDSSSEGDGERDDISEEESDVDDLVEASPARPPQRKSRRDGGEDEPNLIVQTSFDAYFTHSHASKRSQTSSNVFSALVPPLTAEEYTEAIESASARPGLKSIQPSLFSESSRDLLFSRFMRELADGFNILAYGFGSKRRVLNQFATEYCSKAGYVVIANGFQPDFTLKDLIISIENIPGILSADLPSSTIENQAKRIYDFFAPKNRHLYLVIHNIDGAPLRAPKAKSCLALLALNPRIHVVASIDHINAPLLWSSSEASARKPDLHSNPDSSTSASSVPPRGFAWLWHDLTTLASYDFELAYADRSSLSGAHGGGARKKAADIAAQSATAMTETAALHILASVTQKAQKLFSLIGARQLESIEEAAGDGAGAGDRDLQQFAMGYDLLFTSARDNFIATNDTALRSLLGEFRDHSLVVAAQGPAGVGEVLWIPLRKERLNSVLRSLQADS
ncbi:Origin recognition complex subunit 2 [Hypsizygus marmoreus]|uniref:Origin recognition complex subunit 2 n=1 Tax=Hypsizygus marmoreus TaxID=39966 RepID=A0A369K714_HYPMA|nr:Origin recognition complex subunit 2 [Hypsizygus marmoreus]